MSANKDLIEMVEDWTKIDAWLAENPGLIGRRKIYELVNDGTLPHIRHGTWILVPTNLLHVLAYAQELKRGPPSNRHNSGGRQNGRQD